MTAGVNVLCCRLASGTLWLGIYPLLWLFLLDIFGLFLLHWRYELPCWRYELPCQDKLPEFHCTPILGCIRVLWLVFYPLGLGLDKALCGWNSVRKELLQMLVSCFISPFMGLSTTGLILLSLISTFLHHLMKRRVIGSVLPTTKVTVSPGGSSLRILKRSSFVLAFEVPSELQQTSVLHHLQGRGPHFLFPFLILNNLQIPCHLTP